MSAELHLIAALDRRGAIGRGNALPWHLPDDLKRFKSLTLNGSVLMGRKTAESLGRALPKRRNLVLSRSGAAPFAGMQVVRTLAEALADLSAQPLWVIGGGALYALTLPQATRLFLTHVDTEVADADVFFPQWNADDWNVEQRLPHPADERHAYAFEFVDYRPLRRGDKTTRFIVQQ